ncbi:MAG: flavin prenyltransferase [Candidatus Methanomethylophilaceae archaeon]|nr:flavin prenyltransferase [Candidatus Methanomethylophilaceae archaeon]
MKFVVCITGASGIAYGVRLLQELPGHKTLVVSRTAKEILRYECNTAYEELCTQADEFYEDDDLMSPLASGSNAVDAVFIAPCSMSTLSKISHGIADTLITRIATVCLKEHRKLILIPRETPKSEFMLENELRLARIGAVILDANPAFYHLPSSANDMVAFIVGRALEQIGINHNLYRRWGE